MFSLTNVFQLQNKINRFFHLHCHTIIFILTDFKNNIYILYAMSKRFYVYQDSIIFNVYQDGEPFNESDDEEPCIEEGEMNRDVMCVQNNADVVREAL